MQTTINTTLGKLPRMRVKKQVRARKAILDILDIFEQGVIEFKAKNPGKELPANFWLPVSDFNSVIEEYSQPTITRAKKALNIKSLQWHKFHEKSGKILRVGPWKWMKPYRTAEMAFEQLHDEPLTDLMRREIVDPLAQKELEYRRQNTRSIVQLKKIMTDNNYDVPANTVLHVYRDITGFSRRTAFRVKKLLGIRSLTCKATGEWRWLWPCEEVQDWLSKQLEDGELHLTDNIFDKAKKERNWSITLIQAARIETGTIHNQVKDRKVYWYDFNAQLS